MDIPGPETRRARSWSPSCTVFVQQHIGASSLNWSLWWIFKNDTAVQYSWVAMVALWHWEMHTCSHSNACESRNHQTINQKAPVRVRALWYGKYCTRGMSRGPIQHQTLIQHEAKPSACSAYRDPPTTKSPNAILLLSIIFCILALVMPHYTALYRIVENFQGRKRSRISWFLSHPRKFSPRNLSMPYQLLMIGFCIPRKFSLRNSHFLPIRKSFLPWKFCAIRYTCI